MDFTDTDRLWGLQAAILQAISKTGPLGQARILEHVRILPTTLDTYLGDLQTRRLVRMVRGEAYSITSAGQDALQAHHDRAETAKLHAKPVAHPTRDIFSGTYTPDKPGYVRNNGNKHIASAGTARC